MNNEVGRQLVEIERDAKRLVADAQALWVRLSGATTCSTLAKLAAIADDTDEDGEPGKGAVARRTLDELLTLAQAARRMIERKAELRQG